MTERTYEVKTKETTKYEVTNTIVRFDGDLKITVEISNTDDGYKWRMKHSGKCTEWERWYEGILRLGDYCYCTDYWSNIYPTEEPFKMPIIRLKKRPVYK